MTYLQSTTLSKRSFGDDLLGSLPIGRLKEDYIAAIFDGAVANLSKSNSRSGRRLRTKITSNFVDRLSKIRGVLHLIHSSYKHIRSNSYFDTIRLFRIYRNAFGKGAKFGMEEFEIRFGNKFETDVLAQADEHLVSEHALERMFQRHSDYEDRSGEIRFRNFANAQLFSASIFLSGIADDRKSLNVPVKGGMFLAEKTQEGFVVVTFISDLHARSEQREKIKPNSVFTVGMMNGGVAELGQPRKRIFRGREYRGVKSTAWIHQGEKLSEVKSSFQL